MNGTKDAISSEATIREQIEAKAKSRYKVGYWMYALSALSFVAFFVILAFNSDPSGLVSVVFYALMVAPLGFYLVGVSVIADAKGDRTRQLNRVEAAEEAALDHSLVGTKLDAIKRELDEIPEGERNAVIKYLRTHYHK